MSLRTRRTVLGSLLLAVALIATACAKRKEGAASPGLTSPGAVSPSSDPELAKRGSIEVTARLVEIPKGAIFEREGYNYATVLRYEVLEVHRGSVNDKTIFVGHYNPYKPRSKAADRYVPKVGGNLKSFKAGQEHRMALEDSMLDNYMGGIRNMYFGLEPDPIYWAVWTDLVSG